MTQYTPKQITVLDPRTFDGDPFTVAARAADQTAALVKIAAEQAELATIMARNSFMEAVLQNGDELSPTAWDESPYAAKWREAVDSLYAQIKRVETLGRAAGYDPKHPPKVDA